MKIAMELIVGDIGYDGPSRTNREGYTYVIMGPLRR